MSGEKMYLQNTKAQNTKPEAGKSAPSPAPSTQPPAPRPALRVFIAHPEELKYQALKLAVICGNAGMENNLTSHRTFGYDGCDMGIILRESGVTVSIPGRRAVIFNLEVCWNHPELTPELFKELAHPDPHRHRQIYGLTLAAIGLMLLKAES
jgi:hypothetical protein